MNDETITFLYPAHLRRGSDPMISICASPDIVRGGNVYSLLIHYGMKGWPELAAKHKYQGVPEEYHGRHEYIISQELYNALIAEAEKNNIIYRDKR